MLLCRMWILESELKSIKDKDVPSDKTLKDDLLEGISWTSGESAIEDTFACWKKICQLDNVQKDGKGNQEEAKLEEEEKEETEECNKNRNQTYNTGDSVIIFPWRCEHSRSIPFVETQKNKSVPKKLGSKMDILLETDRITSAAMSEIIMLEIRNENTKVISFTFVFILLFSIFYFFFL